MNKDKQSDGAPPSDHSTIIADLRRAIEDLVSHRKKSQQLEGIIDEAKTLAREWTVKEHSGHRRPLFDDTVGNTISLLAGLLIALTRDHQLVERIRRHFPNVLDKLNQESSYEDSAKLALDWASAQPKHTPGQLYERKRSARVRHRPGLIEREFGMVPHPFSDVSPPSRNHRHVA